MPPPAKRIDHSAYGLCEVCHEPIEADCLCRNPLARLCLDHLSSQELKAHAQDLELATQIQAGLLPGRDTVTESWETHYRYEPAGVVSGDYCEIAASGDSQFFALGDVAGKGVAASLLMTHLSAIFRSLRSLEMPFTEVISRANRLFCESTPATHYATMVAGQTTARGANLCNAGHCRPLLLRRHGTERIDSTGLPLGLFCNGRYAFREIRMDPGDSLILYSDGITEAQDPEGTLYEEERLIQALRSHANEGVHLQWRTAFFAMSPTFAALARRMTILLCSSFGAADNRHLHPTSRGILFSNGKSGRGTGWFVAAITTEERTT